MSTQASKKQRKIDRDLHRKQIKERDRQRGIRTDAQSKPRLDHSATHLDIAFCLDEVLTRTNNAGHGRMGRIRVNDTPDAFASM